VRRSVRFLERAMECARLGEAQVQGDIHDAPPRSGAGN
jgi:hypothetical protein